MLCNQAQRLIAGGFMATRILKTLTQIADSQPGLSYNSLRWDIQKRKQELIDKGALFRRGRIWLIDEDLYIEDMHEQARTAA
jgi:hypothetical protein